MSFNRNYVPPKSRRLCFKQWEYSGSDINSIILSTYSPAVFRWLYNSVGNIQKWLSSLFFSGNYIFSGFITIPCLKSFICALSLIKKFVHQILDWNRETCHSHFFFTSHNPNLCVQTFLFLCYCNCGRNQVILQWSFHILHFPPIKISCKSCPQFWLGISYDFLFNSEKFLPMQPLLRRSLICIRP